MLTLPVVGDGNVDLDAVSGQTGVSYMTYWDDVSGKKFNATLAEVTRAE